MIRRSTLSLSLVVALLAACGSTQQVPPRRVATTPAVTPPAPAPTPAGFHGELEGHAFEAAEVELRWHSEQVWELRLGDGGVSGKFTVVRISAVDGAASLAAMNGEPTPVHIEVLAPSVQSYIEVEPATITIDDIQVGPGDPRIGYPQRVGQAHVRLHGELAAGEGHLGGRLEGDTVVPLVMQHAPDWLCLERPPVPTDVPWTATPNVTSATGPIHGKLRGHGFEAHTIYLVKADGVFGLYGDVGLEEDIDHPREGFDLAVPHPLRAGLYEQPMDDRGAHLRACGQFEPAYLSYEAAYAIELTSVRVGRCTNGHVGTASGRVVATFRGAGDGDSWVAGTFTDAPIVAGDCPR